MFTKQDIARYYDLSEVHYRLFWNLDKSQSLHYGYWDKSTKSFHDALLNLNKVLAAKASIVQTDVILDAGCGVGGSSLWLARNFGCRVEGISLTMKQVEKANYFAKEAGLSDNVNFTQQDFSQTHFPSASFDVVWAIESVCHAEDKSLFLREAFRLLKKGGRLVMADFFKTKDLPEKGEKMVKRFANSWAINDFAVWEEFEQQAYESGFQNVETEDAGRAILPSAKRLYRSYFLGKPAAVLYRIFNGKPTSLAANNVDSAYLQYATLKKGWWKYRLVKAVK